MKVIYEDATVLVIDKPAGLVVFPEGQTQVGTLMQQLVAERPELAGVGEPPRYGCVHRLDKDTSGVLLVAKTAQALLFFQKQFISRGVEKKYECLVEGVFSEEFGSIRTWLARSPNDPRKQASYQNQEQAPDSAREAMSEYQVLKHLPGFTLVEVRILTGRKHQIRAQMAGAQHPVAGDKLYRFKNSMVPAGLTRQFLHAASVRITMPDGSQKEFTAPLPSDLQTVLDTLAKEHV